MAAMPAASSSAASAAFTIVGASPQLNLGVGAQPSLRDGHADASWQIDSTSPVSSSRLSAAVAVGGLAGAIGRRRGRRQPAPFCAAASRRRADGGKIARCASSDNTAVVFVKPHARTPAMLELVPQRLKERGVEILRKGTVAADEIDNKGIIDSHYAAIAAVGMTRDMVALPVGDSEKAKFLAGYGVSYDDCLAGGTIHSAVTAVEALEVTPGELLDRCLAAGYEKLRSGLYCARLLDKKDQPIYVMNGFYARMREKFVAPGVIVHWFVVRFDAAQLPWSKFRGEVIGATQPVDAAEGSLRAEILSRWQELGLSTEPNYQDNGIHASAGALEALRERVIWLGDDPKADKFGLAMMDEGLSEEQVKAFLDNPDVMADGKAASIFDLLEDVDSAEALKALKSCTVAS